MIFGSRPGECFPRNPVACDGDNRHGAGHVVEALRTPGTAVVDPRGVLAAEEVQVDRDHVVDVHEVAPLLAVAVARRTDEQLHLARVEKLIEGVKRHRGHAPLVRLVRAVDVEVAKAHYRRAAPRQAPAHVLVEEELGIAVDV